MKLRLISFIAACCSVAPSVSMADADNMRIPLAKDAAEFTQVLPANRSIQLGQTGLDVQSKSYYQQVSGAQLKAGIQLHTSANGAVVRLTPMAKINKGQVNRLSKQSDRAPSLSTQALELSNDQGSLTVDDNSMSLRADSAQLSQAHPSLFQAASAFKIADAMGAGQFTLKTSQSIQDGDRYMVHVFDKNSDLLLKVNTAQASFNQGETLSASVSLSGAKLPSRGIDAVLIAPDGRQWPAKVQDGRVSLPLLLNAERKPGELWTLRVNMKPSQNGLTNAAQLVPRVAELALDIHPETAVLKRFSATASQLVLPMAVKQAGRYEVRAWIYGTNSKGNRAPVALQFSANWLEAGQRELKMNFDRGLFNASGLSAPFYIEQVQLLDQSRLSTLSWQTSGLEIPSAATKR